MIYLFFYAVLIVLGGLSRVSYSTNLIFSDEYRKILLIIGHVFVFLLIGFRYEVGGDWWNYLVNYDSFSELNFYDLNLLNEPLYGAINIVASIFDLGILFVNIVCALIFCYCIFKISLYVNVRDRFMVLLVLFPVLVVIVGMGYTRQSVSVSLAYLAMEYLIRGRIKLFFLFSIISFGFHMSAVAVFLIAASIRFNIYLLLIFFMIFITYFGFSFDWAAIDAVNYYVNNEIGSAGATFRLFVNLLPSLIYLATMNSLQWPVLYKKYILNLSVATILMFAAIFLVPSTTIIDRFSFYLMPVQYVVFSRIPVLSGKIIDKKLSISMILIFYVLLLFGIIFISNNFDGWLPYDNYIIKFPGFLV